MTLAEQAFTQAALLSGELDGQQTDLLKVLCGAAAASLTARLRDGITVDECKEVLVAAASLMALSALDEQDGGAVEEFKAGDLSVKRENQKAASRCLERQAERMMAPYLQDRFAFQGV